MSDQAKSYKETLNLPRTEFPMKADLVEREPERLRRWEEGKLYAAIDGQREREGAETFILHDGPPFANGDVHMGTALNKVLKDLVVKSKTMAGYRAPFVPGWDCHGLPIEFKVVQEAKGLSALEIRRRAEEFARKYLGIQRESFRRLGVFGDWENPYLTLDPAYEADILRVFATMVERDLIYQSKKPVSWSWGARTALAEAEVEYQERKDTAVFVKFPVVEGLLAGETALVIWTTTPWTLPANLGVALHPDFLYVRGTFRHEDGRREDLVMAKTLVEAFGRATGFRWEEDEAAEERRGGEFAGSFCQHPFLERRSKVILGNFVDDSTGTGAVHIAPGHGAVDYVAGQEHGLGLLSPVDDDGRFTGEVGVEELVGQHVLKGNARVVEILAEKGFLLGREEYSHSYPHCWRSKTPVIFRAVEQFFIRIDRLRETALREIDEVEWLPHWGRNRIYGTVEARPDWCISRQRTWGVPLPVFHLEDGSVLLDAEVVRRVADIIEEGGTNLWFEWDDAMWVEKLGLPAGARRGTDTLDVWIDSGCSHVAVLERHPDLSRPADLYLEATDQHRGWFQSSLMLSVAVRGKAPYKRVMTHGFVIDHETGGKLSKSKQQSQAGGEKAEGKKKKKEKPTEASHYYNQYGADVVRLWVASVDWQNDVPFGEDLFQQIREPYRRFRNSLRILVANLYDFEVEKDAVASGGLGLLDRWILQRLNQVIQACRVAYEELDFRRVYHELNQFCAVDLSALYVDCTKDRMYCDAADSGRRRATQTAMHRVFEAVAKLLAPMLAFTADEAWEYAGKKRPIHLERFPGPDAEFSGTDAIEKMRELLRVRDAVQAKVDEAIKGGAFKKRERAVALVGLRREEPVWGVWEGHREEVLEFLMLSGLELEEGAGAGGEWQVRVRETEQPECPRCRRSLVLDREGLCGRCDEVVEGLEVAGV